MYSKDNFINREISWLSFNERVLQEAKDPNTPLLERLRFIGIFSNNLDEFFRVRVATVRRMVDIGKDEENLLGNYTPKELYRNITKTVKAQQEKVLKIQQNLTKELEENNIFIVNEKNLTNSQGIFVKKYFYEKVLPNLVPIMLDKKHKFPYLRDRSVYLAVKLYKKTSPEEFAYSLIRIPGITVPRFLVLPQVGKKQYVIILDDVVRYCLDDLFFYFDYDSYDAYTIKVTRDAELDIDDDISKSFIEKMSQSVKKRKKGRPIRLIYDEQIDKEMLKFILKKIKIKQTENAPGGRYHNRKDFMDFPEIGSKKHYYQKLPPIRHKDLPMHTSILSVLRKKDVMLHYPYQTFNHFIDFLREVAIDPKVEEIGVTIYRVASESKVINALLNAVRNGKKVTVVIELQARFDEEANIFWSNKLQEEGADVINGVPGMKVHSKLAWVQRRENDSLQNYAYIGTGNFHEGTARVYADDGLMTSDARITNEVADIFKFFKHNYKHFDYNHLIVSPFYLRDFFVDKIDNEIKLAKQGKTAYMILKMNSLIDPGMMRKLYEASQAGVKIQLIVRGIFGLEIGKKGMSENVSAISIVDKFLEHSRVFLFGNNGNEEIFIASADWMPRNLNRRIEVACPIYDKDIKNELRKMLEIQLKDNTKARILDANLQNSYAVGDANQKFRAQKDFYNYIKEKHHIVMKIYHHTRCSKSRAALKYIEERGMEVQVRKYFDEPLTKKELQNLLEKMPESKAEDLVRKHESLYKEKYKDKQLNDDQWLDVLIENPQLIKRPIVEHNGKAIVAIPAIEVEKVL